MKILFLPDNIASLQSITAEALNKINGIEAICLTGPVHKYQTINKATIVMPGRLLSRKNPIKWLYKKWIFTKQLKKWIIWADVIQYVWGPAFKNGKDLRWAKKMNKPIFIEWVGSDLRDPDILSVINRYYKSVFNNGYEYQKFENSDYKKVVQHLFSEAAAKPMVGAEMSLFLDRILFPEYITLMQRLDLNEFLPHYPDSEKIKPLIIHSPSAKVAKGSNIILEAIEGLKKEMDFDFILLNNISREEVLTIMKKADIFLDQVIIGGYGMAATEALAFGKPVLCYLMPELFEAGMPKECPIVNTNPDNLKEQLIKLISNPQLRHDIGRQGREYVEKYHDADKIANQLIDIYEAALESKKKNNV